MSRISRALIADSNLATLNEMAARLRPIGCLALTETSASRITRRARAERPDVVILGMAFTDSEQVQVAEELKTDPVTRRIPLVLAGPDIQHVAIGGNLMARLDGMVPLPIVAEELQAKLAAALRLKIMRAELLRRRVTFGRYGIDGFSGSDAQPAMPGRVLFVRPGHGQLASQTDDLMGLLPATGQVDSVERDNVLEALLKNRYDVVGILGAGAPDDVGLELCRDIRRHSSMFHLPIVFFEPGTNGALRAGAFDSGASEVLGSPFDGGAVARVLELAGRRAALRTRLHADYKCGVNPETNDPQTGLFAAHFLHKHLEILIEDAFRWDLSLSVVTCVVPQLVAIRRDHGHDAAAALQRNLASLFSRLVRGEDLCASLGDEKFCIVTPECSLDGVAPIMHRLRGVIDHTQFGVPDVNQPIMLHAELGSAGFKPGDTVESLLGRAQDAALRSAA